jgi:dTDP-4-dehydrorhamnose reductase
MTSRDRVLVVGAAGLVGSHVDQALGDRAIGSTHRTPVAGAETIDVTDARQVDEVVGRLRPSAIVTAAAEPWVERCEREPDFTRHVNVGGTETLANAARRVGATLVVFSSEYVFDGTAGPYGEDDPVRPINEYGRQKVEIERIVRDLPKHVVCRISGVFGWERARKNFVCRLVDRLRARQRFDVPNDQVITPTYAPRLADAIVELLDLGASGTFHAAGPEILGRVAFAERVARIFGLDPAFIRGRPTAALGSVAARPAAAGLLTEKLRLTVGHDLGLLDDALTAMVRTEPTAL